MRRFIEVLIPVTACNLKCSYCYVIQLGWRTNRGLNLKYSAETIGKALSKQRLGGVSLISLTGAGETMLPADFSAVVSEILKQGHFVNITTNGTLTKRFEQMMQATKGYHTHLHFSFSLHYVELKKHNLLDKFFDNVRIVKESGCSFLVQINLADEYWDCWDDIKTICIERIGAMPQVALTRKEKTPQCNKFTIKTSHTKEEYIAKGREMKSPLFDYTCQNFNVNRKKYFCYAGFWSAKLNLKTGELSGCYGNGVRQNIFKEISKPIKWEPIGNHCCFDYCINSSHFLSQGVIPEIMPQPSYAGLRNRPEANWYTDEMEQFLSSQFEDTNPKLNFIERKYYNLIYSYKKYLSYTISIIKKHFYDI